MSSLPWSDLVARCLAPSPGPGATGSELADTLAALYRDGLDPDWDQLYEPAQRVRRRLRAYQFSTEHRFWPEPTARTTPSTPSEEITMDNLIALFREQNAVLASLVAGPSDLGSPQQAAPRTTPEAVAGVVRGQLARVSGLPADRLRDAQTLSDELGFDSMMLADLFGGLVRKLPG
ncbi:acyl carrier protein [Nocardia sp. NBC_00881]|uniref:phosphopantetheine-binding protein n=1 Tax=Nocardia sp. NBC_00881 TaxID=2975995 RepID=UPI003870EB36|nr:acyl carrier protein [Nocardia sp. NBC_00881]